LVVLYKLFNLIEPEDLIGYGLIPELVGRLPVQTALSELDEEALIQILTKPKNSVVKQFQEIFAMEGVKLSFRKPALSAILLLIVFCFLVVSYTITGDFFFSTTGLSITTSFISLSDGNSNMVSREKPHRVIQPY
jgi:hypothetical protein